MQPTGYKEFIVNNRLMGRFSLVLEVVITDYHRYIRRIRVVNGLAPNESVNPGDLVKLVVE